MDGFCHDDGVLDCLGAGRVESGTAGLNQKEGCDWDEEAFHCGLLFGGGCYLFAELADFVLELGVLGAETVNGGFEFLVFLPDCDYFLIAGSDVFKEALVLGGEKIDGGLEVLQEIVPALAGAGKPSDGCCGQRDEIGADK